MFTSYNNAQLQKILNSIVTPDVTDDCKIVSNADSDDSVFSTINSPQIKCKCL